MNITIYKTIILPVVMYGRETWSLTLREERRLRVFENRVLRRIFGSKRDEVIGVWRNLRNEELHNLYTPPSIIKMMNSRRMRWTGHVARMRTKRDEYVILVGKPGGKRPLERSRRWWVENIKMTLGEIGWDAMDWIDLAQDIDQWRALVNTVKNLQVPCKVGKFLRSCTVCGFSRRAQLHVIGLV
jgi:hypothetical protein